MATNYPEYMQFEGSEFDYTGYEPWHALETEHVVSEVNRLCANGWHYTIQLQQGVVTRLVGMQPDTLTGSDFYCSVLQAVIAERLDSFYPGPEEYPDNDTAL